MDEVLIVKDKVFVLALLAAQSNPSGKGRPKVQCEPWAVVADSLVSAESLGLSRCRELWPESAGWTFHAAHGAELVIHTVIDKESQDTGLTIDLIM